LENGGLSRFVGGRSRLSSSVYQIPSIICCGLRLAQRISSKSPSGKIGFLSKPLVWSSV
jgi:hypothetical protein